MKMEQFDQMVDLAMDAFWESIALSNPTAEFGDFEPLADYAFKIACKHAAFEWIINNVPEPDLERTGS